MKVSISQIWAALISVASGFVPLPFRWAVQLLNDLFTSHPANADGNALAAEAPLAAPSDLKAIIQSIFDSLNGFLSGRPFVAAVVKALEAFILNNLLDAIYDKLTNKGAAMAAGSVPMHYQPAKAEALCKELEAAVAIGH